MKSYISFINESEENINSIIQYQDGSFWEKGLNKYNVIYTLKNNSESLITLIIYKDNITDIESSPTVLGTLEPHYQDRIIDLIQQEDLNINTESFLKAFDLAHINNLIKYEQYNLFDIDLISKLLEKNLLSKQVFSKLLEHLEMNGYIIYLILEYKLMTKEQIKSILPNKLINFSEYMLYQLYKDKILDKYDFVEYFDDLNVIDDEIVLYIDKWDDLENFMNDKYHYRNHTKTRGGNYIINLLDGDCDIFMDNDYSEDNTSKNIWDIIKKESKEYIISCCSAITFDNTHTLAEAFWDEKNKDFYIKIDGEKTDVIDIIMEYKDEFNNIHQGLRWANNDACSDSVESQAYENVVKSIKNLFGDYKRIRGRRSEDGKYFIERIIFPEVELSKLEDCEKYSKSDLEYYTDKVYSGYLDFYYEEIFQNQDQPEKIDIHEPYYGFHCDIDDTIDEYIINQNFN